MKAWLTAVFVIAFSVPARAASVRDAAPQIVDTVLQFHPGTARPQSIDAIPAACVVLRRGGGFHIELVGDHFELVRKLLVAMCGEPMETEEMVATSSSRRAKFKGCFLLYFPDRDATVVFGFGRYMPELASRDRRNASAELIDRVEPHFPFDLRKKGVEGSVVVGFRVDFTGTVRDVYIIESTHEEFSLAVLRAVIHWRFLPAMVDGRPIVAPVRIPIEFKITKESKAEPNNKTPDRARFHGPKAR